jgi:hypothetical protein
VFLEIDAIGAFVTYLVEPCETEILTQNRKCFFSNLDPLFNPPSIDRTVRCVSQQSTCASSLGTAVHYTANPPVSRLNKAVLTASRGVLP